LLTNWSAIPRINAPKNIMLQTPMMTAVKMTRVRRRFRFEAAHELPNHPGKCRELHGHSFRLVVTVERPVEPESGMAIDFGDLRVGDSVMVVGRIRPESGALLSSLNLAAFPTREGDARAYLAGNQVADAVFLYALVQGPLWDAVTGRA